MTHCHLVVIVVSILRIHRDVSDLGTTMAFQGSMSLMCDVLTSVRFF